MILALGQMIVYLIFLALPGALNSAVSKLKNHFVARVAILLVISYLGFIIDALIHWHGDIVFMDGLCHINPLILVGEVYLMGLIIAIIHLQSLYSKRPELYLLVLSNVIGQIYLISSNDFTITICAWELFNLSLYQLASINCESERSQSAAIKYFLLSALTTTFLLLAVALLYAYTGSTHYDSISLSQAVSPDSWPYYLPLGQMMVTFLFKLGAAPFHQWVPDLYDGVPTPITAWMTHIPKIAVLIFQISIYPLGILTNLEPLLLLAGSLSMIIGSIGLGGQYRIKRFLAYSAISHLGFQILAQYSMQLDSYMYYIFIYGITSQNIFSIQLVMGTLNREVQLISQLSGLWSRNQALSLAFSMSLFSQAGIPPLAGFFAKLMVIQAYLNIGNLAIAMCAIQASVISAANYLQIIKVSNLDLALSATPIVVPRSISYLISSLSTLIVLFMLIGVWV